jgi:uncharacterized membrane protein YkoI
MICSVVLLGLTLVISPARAADKEEAKEHEEAKNALAEAKISLAQAVEIALKAVPGGKAVEAEIDLEGADDVDFDVEVIVDGAHKKVEIDGVTGKVEVIEKEADEKDEEEKTEAAVASSQTTLLQAIEIALKAVPGATAYKAEPQMEKGKLIWEVEVMSGDQFKDVEIDPATGKVLEVENDDD